MSLAIARDAMALHDYESAIAACQAYALTDAPPSLVYAARRVCQDAFLAYTNKKARSYVYSHSFELQGAPLALYGLAENGFFGKTLQVICPFDGVLANKYRSILGANVIYPPFELRNTLAGLCSEERQVDSLAIWLAGKFPSFIFINTTRGVWLAQACRLLGICYDWWIHEAEDPFSYLPDIRAKDRAINVFLRSPSVLYASNDVMLRYETSLNCSAASRQVFRPEYVRKSLVETRDRVSRDTAEKLLNMRGKYLILSVGTYCQRKNQIEIINSFLNLVPCVEPGVVLALIGSKEADPSYYATMLSQLPDGCPSRVWFIEPTDDIGLWYLAARIYVHAAIDESFCQAVLEARFFGLPIIYRKCRGMGEVLSGYANSVAYGRREELSLQLSKYLKIVR